MIHSPVSRHQQESETMENHALLAQLDASTSGILETVGDAADARHGWKRDASSWSALECIEHIAVTEIGILRVLSGASSGSDEGAELIGKARIDEALGDRTRRYTAPDFAAPRGRYATMAEAIAAFAGTRERMREKLADGTIRLDGATRAHPLLGEMTKMDWFHFLLAHAERHRAQIAETLIAAAL
jgi:hypothetical protein